MNFTKLLFSSVFVFLCNAQAMAQEHCTTNDTLTVFSSTDDGRYEETHGPDNALDNNFDPESRWSNLGQGQPKHLLINLGAIQTVRRLGVAWYKGDQRKATFSVDFSIDGKDFMNILSKGQSSGKTLDLEIYSFESIQAQFLRISADGNDANEWNSIVEVNVTGCLVKVERPS